MNTNTELKKSQKKRVFQRLSQNLELVTNKNGKITSVNLPFCKLLGCSPHHLVSLHLEELPHLAFESQNALLHRYVDHMGNNTPAPYELTFHQTSIGTITIHITPHLLKKKGLTLGEIHTVTAIMDETGKNISSKAINKLPDPTPETDQTVHHEFIEENNELYYQLALKNNQLYDQLGHIQNLNEELDLLEQRDQHHHKDDVVSLQTEITQKQAIIHDLASQLQDNHSHHILSSKPHKELLEQVEEKNEEIRSLEREIDTKNHIITDLNHQLQQLHTSFIHQTNETQSLKIELIDKHEHIQSLNENLQAKSELIEHLKNQVHDHHNGLLRTALERYEQLQPGDLKEITPIPLQTTQPEDHILTPESTSSPLMKQHLRQEDKDD